MPFSQEIDESPDQATELFYDDSLLATSISNASWGLQSYRHWGLMMGNTQAIQYHNY